MIIRIACSAQLIAADEVSAAIPGDEVAGNGLP